MSQTTSFLSALLMLAWTSGCKSDQHQSEALIRANELHIDALAIAGKVEQRLDSIRQQTDDATIRHRLDSLDHLIELWEEGLVEVPGFVHEHHHGHHEHKPAPKMTDESMLQYQAAAKEAIGLIRDQLDRELTKTARR